MDGNAVPNVPEPVEIAARLCVWRVLGVANDYGDRPVDQSPWRSSPATFDGGLELSVSIGDVPGVVPDALRSWRAHANYLLNDMFGRHYEGMSIEDRRGVLADMEAGIEIGDFKDCPTFVTLEASRPMTLRGDPDARFLWASDDQPTAEHFRTFERIAGEALDALVAWVLPQLGAQLQLASVRLGGERAYVVAPGKAALAAPRVSMTAAGLVLLGTGWQQLPFGALDDKLRTFAGVFPSLTRHLARAGRWLLLALAEVDSLRRFLFAYCGLEVLVQQTHVSVRRELVAGLGREQPELPVEHLLWPSVPDDAAPFRNLVFKFASLATVVARDSALNDVAAFRAIAKARNDLAHGGADDLDDLPAASAIELLRRYIVATSTALEAGRLP